MNIAFLYRKWAKRFLEEWHANPSLLGTDSDRHLVQDEIEFVGTYLGFMILDEDSKTNLQRIKHFLSLQTYGNPDKLMKMKFLQGSPAEVFLFAEVTDDIDFADTLGILDFSRMEVYLKDGSNWTMQNAREFIEDVRTDLEFDGYDPVLEFEIRKALLKIKLKIV